MTSTTLQPKRLLIKGLVDVVMARRQGLEMAQALGFPLPEATKIAVVISELARNIILYAKEGVILITPVFQDRKGIQIKAEDNGPGIPDVPKVLAGGYTTSKGMGLGLSGSKRLMDEFEIKSAVGKGVQITAIKWLR